MPTVPTSFVPSVAPAAAGDVGQFQAPQVAVAENMAAQQEAQFGRAMTQVGDIAFRIGSAMQDAIDEAQTKEVDTWWLNRANEIMRGKTGYMRTTGKDADALYEQANTALADAGEQALGKLQNETQRSMYRSILARNMGSLQGQMLEHRGTQIKVYAQNEAKARADQYARLAVDDADNRDLPLSDYQINRGVALAEIKKAASLQGIEEGSAQMRAFEQVVDTQITQGVVNRLMMRGKYDEAYKFAEQQIKDGRVDSRVSEDLLKAVDINRDRWLAEQYATTIKQFGRVGMPDDKDNTPSKAPESLRAALDLADSIKDPEIRKGVHANLKQQYAEDEAVARQDYQNIVDQAEQFLATPGNNYNMLPPEIVSKLKPKDRAVFMSNQLRKDDLDVQEMLARNPQLLTREFIDKYRGRMTQETAIRLTKDLNDPEKIMEATFDADSFNETAMQNNMGQLISPKTDDEKRMSYDYRTDIKNRIDVEQRRIGRKLGLEEKRKIIDAVFIQKSETAFVPRSFLGIDVLWRDATRTMESLTTAERAEAYIEIPTDEGVDVVRIDDVPSSWVTRVAMPAFRKGGNPYPSFRQIAELWIKKGSPAE